MNRYDFLIVDEFVNDFLATQTLKTAIELGLLDSLEQGESKLDSLLAKIPADQQGLNFLLQQLQHQNVLLVDNKKISLTEKFYKAWQYKDLIKCKIKFANLVAPDLLENFSDFVGNYSVFMNKSKIFGMFDYQKAIEINADNIAYTANWMELTSTLTRYESKALLANYDFKQHKKLMDIGGNSGEFSLQILKSYPQLNATVIDLPVVCEVGRRHISTHEEAKRIQFIASDALEKALPKNNDIVTFKSILHDWPAPAVERFLSQAFEALPSGGRVLIFEREAMDLNSYPQNFGQLATLLFFRHYRDPNLYLELLAKLGFEGIEYSQVQLETPFALVIAVKP